MAEKLEAKNTEGGAQPLKLFITGAGSSAGLALVREAAKQGHRVVGATLKGTVGANRIREAGGIPVYPELARESALRSAISMARADVVINCVPQMFNGLPQHRIDYDKSAHLIEEGTEALVAAAGKLGVKRLIHISPACLYGETHGAATEDSPIQHGNVLLNAAAEAEEAVFDGGVHGHVVRAGVIYGGWHDSMATLAADLRAGRGIASGTGKVSWIHESDLAAALLKLAEIEIEEEALANILNIADDSPMTYNEFMKIFGAAYGVGEPNRLSGLMVPLRTNAIQLELLAQTTVIDNSKAKTVLGWEPKVASKEAGIERSMLIWRALEADALAPGKSAKELAVT